MLMSEDHLSNGSAQFSATLLDLPPRYEFCLGAVDRNFWWFLKGIKLLYNISTLGIGSVFRAISKRNQIHLLIRRVILAIPAYNL